MHLTLADGKTIDATEGHPFNTPEGWRDALLLKKGGQVILKGENGEAKSIEIADVSFAQRRLTTYNLEVANAHTFFVGEDAVLVHNCRDSSERQALVAMAKQDKKTGMSADDMQAYKDLNKELTDPFPTNKVRGPESHPDRNYTDIHGHVGPVDHIPIR